MVLAEIRDLIRAEANLQGLDEYTVLIDSILNQELQQMTGKSKYTELLDSDTLTSTGDGMHLFSLPADFQLFGDLQYFQSGELQSIPLGQGIRNQYQAHIEGYPQYYAIVGTQLQIYPYSSFYLGDYLILGYYKKPQLVLDSDVFPVSSLEKAVIQATMGRMLRMVDTKRAQMATADADKAWIESRAINVAN